MLAQVVDGLFQFFLRHAALLLEPLQRFGLHLLKAGLEAGGAVAQVGDVSVHVRGQFLAGALKGHGVTLHAGILPGKFLLVKLLHRRAHGRAQAHHGMIHGDAHARAGLLQIGDGLRDEHGLFPGQFPGARKQRRTAIQKVFNGFARVLFRDRAAVIQPLKHFFLRGGDPFRQRHILGQRRRSQQQRQSKGQRPHPSFHRLNLSFRKVRPWAAQGQYIRPALACQPPSRRLCRFAAFFFTTADRLQTARGKRARPVFRGAARDFRTFSQISG